MGVLWKREPHTEAKHRLYRGYLDAWWPILLQLDWVRRLTYVEAFAGPGTYVGGEPGSPVLALRSLLGHGKLHGMNVRRDRVQLLFMEKSKARALNLEEVLVDEFGPLDELPCEVHIKHEADATTDLSTVLTEHDAWGSPILAVLDSWSNVAVPWADVARIGANPSSEALVTFGPHWFQRWREMSSEQIDLVMGGRERWASRNHTSTSTFATWQNWLTTYQASLEAAGFQYQLAFEVRPANGVPLYVVYGTDSDRGVEKFKDSMWKVDRRDGMAYRDPRCTAALPGEEQLALFGGAAEDTRVDPELRFLVSERIKSAPLTLDELRRWVLLKTAQWRQQDARRAVIELFDDKRIGYRPQKRLNGHTELFWIN
jgi:three-Cys-motif partner protein